MCAIGLFDIMTRKEYSYLMGKRQGNWVTRARAWVKEHPKWMSFFRFLISFLQFILFGIFFHGALVVFGTVPVYGVPIMAGVILLMIAGFFFKASTGMQDMYYEDKTALDVAMRLEDRVSDLENKLSEI